MRLRARIVVTMVAGVVAGCSNPASNGGDGAVGDAGGLDGRIANTDAGPVDGATRIADAALDATGLDAIVPPGLDGAADLAVPALDGAAPDLAMVLPMDASLPLDGPAISCAAIGQACVNGATCCSGLCDNGACAPPGNVCAARGASCVLATDCCSLRCANGACGAQCTPNGQACATAGDCCSGSCVAGACAAVVAGCATLGNACGANGDCCSQNCQGGLCAPQGGNCNAIGDVCFSGSGCCSGVCVIPNGATAGTCASGGGTCTADGEPCSGCSGCCSRVCAPTATGGHICVPASGCRLIGDLCRKDSDCCGGGATGLPGANEVVCTIIAGSNPPVGTCSNPTGCDPDGDVCGLASGNNTCGNSRHDCCDCIPPKINCCKLDRAGVPRCYGGSTTSCPSGYDGTPGCCIAAGQICAFSSECCGGAPCVPDGSGQLRCGTSCGTVGQTCVADSDCCAGLPCTVPRGQLAGTCGAPAPPPDMAIAPDLSTAPRDMAGAPSDLAGVKPPDLTGAPRDLGTSPPPDLSSRPPDLSHAPDLAVPACSLVGQSCGGSQACCSGLVCSPPSGVGTCAPNETDCTCFGTIG